MCGIAGLIEAGDRPLDRRLLEAMATALAHRGPDGEGYVLLAPGGREKPFAVAGGLSRALGAREPATGAFRVGFGHRRLAIVDLTPLGRQPMGTDDGRFWITYNGEVYNAPELRRELTALGHRFRSMSDTEVVLAAYRQWGGGCLARFNGMFAFAIWDGEADCLFCARDRFGIKPFYYREDGSRWLFASEIKALLCDPALRRRPNDRALFDYLTQGRQDHTTETFFDGVRQLAPGECLTVRLRPDSTGLVVEHRHWYRLPEGAERLAPQDAAARLRDLLEDSVRVQLRADVPVGSCLSGGLDSSSIVCLMARVVPAGTPPPQTFSSCQEDERFDERRYIREVVARTGVRNHEVFPNAEELYQGLPQIMWHHDEPFAGTSMLAQWAVMRAAGHAGVKVLLDGQGSDEVLCGYPRFMGSRIADLIRAGRWGRAWREWAAWRQVHQAVHPTTMAAMVRGLLPTGLVRRLRARVTGETAWLNPAWLRACSDAAESPLKPREGRSLLAAHQVQALTQDLPALLHAEDRNSMAFSVEARVPFLDHRLVEWLVRLPVEHKIRDGMTKAVLRDAMAGVLPDQVRLRRDKMGFVTPEDHWLRVSLRRQIQETLESESLRGRPYWRANVLQDWFTRYCEDAMTIGPTVWRWVNLEWWLRRFCD